MKNIVTKEMNRVLYWTTLLVLTIANFFIAIVLIPFLLALSSFPLYIVVMVLGLIVGMIFNHLVKDIEFLERKHHLFAAFFIPVIGVIDIFMVVSVARRIADVILLDVRGDAMTVSLVFVSAFLFPYIVTAGKR